METNQYSSASYLLQPCIHDCNHGIVDIVSKNNTLLQLLQFYWAIGLKAIGYLFIERGYTGTY